MDIKLIVGFDTGSEKLNWHSLDPKEVDMGNGEFTNSSESIIAWAGELLTERSLIAGKVLVCIEDTGLYSLNLAYELQLLGFKVWLQDALHLNKSLGRVKTKNDVLDAYRITRYAVRNHADYVPFVPNEEVLQSIKSLIGQRKRLIKTKNILSVPVAQERKFLPITPDEANYTDTDECVARIKAAIKAIDKKIDKLIQQDERYKKTYDILTSLPGIGKVIARLMIIKTNNFVRGYDSKKLASLFGISPHERQSGKCLNRKPKTHPNVDREVKSCLYLGMLRHTRGDNKLGKYYKRKSAEGKHHNSITNAMANITLGTACACLKKGVMYDENYVRELA